MTSTADFPQGSAEVAHRTGVNIRRTLNAEGHDVTWLADELGVSVDGLLKAFSERMPFGLLFDIADALRVRPDSLLEGVPA